MVRSDNGKCEMFGAFKLRATRRGCALDGIGVDRRRTRDVGARRRVGENGEQSKRGREMSSRGEKVCNVATGRVGAGAGDRGGVEIACNTDLARFRDGNRWFEWPWRFFGCALAVDDGEW